MVDIVRERQLCGARRHTRVSSWFTICMLEIRLSTLDRHYHHSRLTRWDIHVKPDMLLESAVGIWFTCLTSDFQHYQHWRCTCITIVRSTLPLSVIVMYYPYFLKPDRTGQFNPVYRVKPVRFGLSHQVAANPGFFQNRCTSSFENHLVQCWTGIIGLSGSRQGPGYQWKCWFFIDGELRHFPPLGRSETKYIVCSGMK